MLIVGVIKNFVRRHYKYVRNTLIQKKIEFKKKVVEQNKKIIQFEMTYACNYNCEYCLQEDYRRSLKKSNNLNASDEVVGGFINFIKNYKNKCKVMLLGGEIFMHKRIFDVAEAILSTGHDVDIITNFSFPNEVYERILSYRKKGAHVHVGISLHLSQIGDMEKFKIKLDKFFELQKNDGYFTIALQAVLIEENFEVLKEFNEYIQERYKIKLLFQDYKEKWNSSAIEYSDKVNRYLSEMGNVDAEFTRKSCKEFDSIYGTDCAAGEKFCLIKPDGTIYRCYDSYNQGCLGILGDIKSGKIGFHKKAMPCLSNNCSCSLFYHLGLVKLGHKNIREIRRCEKKYLNKECKDLFHM